MKGIKHRLKLVWHSLKVAASYPNLPMTDSVVLAQWGKENRSFIVTRSVNYMVGLLLGQVAIIKNGKKGIDVNNKKFLNWTVDCLDYILKKTPKNTPPYEYLHRRKVKMRPRRKYRFKLQEAN